MANFNITYDKYIKPIEGGYANIAADKGGETYAGIARRFWPSLAIIWNFIDAHKAKYGAIKNNTKFKELDQPVREFYQNMYTKNGFDKINNQDIADIVFDWFVNSGSLAFHTKGTETFGVDEILATQFGKSVPVDGKLDTTTINAINSVDPVRLHTAIKKARIDFYNKLVQDDSSQAVFLKGWLARISKFPTLAKVGIGLAGVAMVTALFFLTYKALS